MEQDLILFAREIATWLLTFWSSIRCDVPFGNQSPKGSGYGTVDQWHIFPGLDPKEQYHQGSFGNWLSSRGRVEIFQGHMFAEFFSNMYLVQIRLHGFQIMAFFHIDPLAALMPTSWEFRFRNMAFPDQAQQV